MEIDRIKMEQYKGGKKIIDSSEESKKLLEKLKEECPHVPEEELIMLFRSVAAGTKMVDSAIISSSHVKEYNAMHPSPKEEVWLDKFFSSDARKIMKPEDVMKDEKLYKAIIKVINDTEEWFDDWEVAPLSAIKANITNFLKNVKGK
jgi:hypothetical protein